MMKHFFRCLFCLLTLATALPAVAKIKTEEFHGNIYVKDASVEELETLFTAHKYQRFVVRKDNSYPAIFTKSLPEGFDKIPSATERNNLFIRILAPIALKINEEIATERNLLLRLEKKFLKDGNLNEKDLNKIEELALKYDFFTRLKGKDRLETQLYNLKRRINFVPPSILIAVAAIESNWGTSRPALVANALYKEKVWNTTEGLLPLENQDDGYRFKIFKSLTEAMRSYALTFNSSLNYQNVWSARESLLERHGVIYGEDIAYSLSLASNLPNYAGITDYTTAFYDLYSIDKGYLDRGKKK
jgi:Bax protein